MAHLAADQLGRRVDAVQHVGRDLGHARLPRVFEELALRRLLLARLAHRFGGFLAVEEEVPRGQQDDDDRPAATTTTMPDWRQLRYRKVATDALPA